MKSCLLLIGLFFVLVNCSAQDSNLQQARENIRKALQIETDQVSKEEAWANEKARLKLELQLLNSQKDDLKKEISEVEESIQKMKKAQQISAESQRDIQSQHQIILQNLKSSVEILDSKEYQIPDDENLKQMLKSMQNAVKQPQFHSVLLFNQLIDFHQQWWQMSQSYQIRSDTVMIEGKEYHGEIIRLGLVYRFLLFTDQSRFAYFDAPTNQWKFGKEEDCKKILKIKNVLTKNEPAQIIYLPSR